MPTRQVLGIVGSPRRGGNTETLVDEVLRGAADTGALVEKVILTDLNIAPCQACGGCGETGECVQQDDMQALLDKMARSQVWVLGTPVYWWGPTAQFKAFLDRWYSVERAVFAGRQVVLVIPLGGSARYARHTVGMLTDVLSYLGMELVTTVLAPGTSGPGSVRRRADLMAQACQAGQAAAICQGDEQERLK
jgi:multimeric flavodoxin WrbA